MIRRLVLALLLPCALVSFARAQGNPPPRVALEPQFKSPRVADTRNNVASPAESPANPPAAAGDAAGDQTARAPIEVSARPPIARVSKGPSTLPNEHGQVWREYDITPYTARVTSTVTPEQALVDWVLRETGYEAWHREPLGILCASRRALRVYHTPEMHAAVGELVDRFVNSEAESYAFGVNVITIGNPNWRAKSHGVLRPISVESQGVQAWLLAKEDAAMLLADLGRRTDFRIHSSPHLLINNGQAEVISAMRPRTYMRDVALRPEAWPGFEMEVGQINEGFSLELSPLLGIDGSTIDVVLKCNIDQVEKMVPVMLEVPTPVAPRQRAKIEVPRVSQVRLHERFHWPADQVLLVGLGVVATPVPETRDPILSAIPFMSGPPRADLLVFVEGKGKDGHAPTVSGAEREASRYNGRY